jgi:GNAT superfamily N-acetyltransferase
MKPPPYVLRAARADDLEPMMRIAHEGIRPWVEAVSGRWDAAEHESKFRERFDVAAISIVHVEGEDVGYIKLEREPDHDFLAGIYLAASQRNRGLGRAILVDLLRQSAAARRPLRLRVLHPNPARRLYQRVGFIVTHRTETHVHMESPPAPPSAAAQGGNDNADAQR